MVDPISGSQLASIAGNNGVAQPADPSSLGGANPKDAAMFAEAMNQPPDAPMPPDAVEGTQGPGMLDNLDKISADMRSMQTGLESATGAMGEVGDLLRTQFQVAQLTMTQTMIGQVGQKTSQGTQQLLKGQ